MKRKKVLIVCSNYWDSPIQVGDQHLARKFVEAGWDVGYISTPISPLHILTGVTSELRDRFNNYRSEGAWDMEGHLWSYVPGAFFVPHNKPLLRNKWVYNNWYKFTWPNLLDVAAKNGFGDVDVLYFREPKQAFWFNKIKHKVSIYRIADNDSGFLTYNKEVQRFEKSLAESVDLVVYTAKNLQAYVNKLKPKRTLYLPNGVNFSHFADGSKEVPKEFNKVQRPIVIYVGSMDFWFDFDLINYASYSLPSVSFVMIGPDKLAHERLIRRPNLQILGRRSYYDIPSYLHNADIGIIPFDVVKYPNLVNSINPLKLYEYLACGLPVISPEWEELKDLQSPAIFYKSKEDFVQKVISTLSAQHDKAIYITYAEKQDWIKRFHVLEGQINSLLSRWPDRSD
jgi:glycosyltransferase involved in cell wall biosynthesis